MLELILPWKQIFQPNKSNFFKNKRLESSKMLKLTQIYILRHVILWKCLDKFIICINDLMGINSGPWFLPMNSDQAAKTRI